MTLSVSPKTTQEELPFQDGHERQGIHPGRIADQPGGYGQDQQAMGDPLSERPLLRELAVAVKRIEVPRQPREQDHVGFGNGPTRSLPFVADSKVVQGEYVERASRHDQQASI